MPEVHLFTSAQLESISFIQSFKALSAIDLAPWVLAGALSLSV